MDSLYINNKRRHSNEIKKSSIKNKQKKSNYSSGEESQDNITEENIEDKKEIKGMSSQLQDNNKRNQRMEFRRKELEQINKKQNKFLEIINDLKSNVDSLRKENRCLSIKVNNLENNNNKEALIKNIINLKKDREADHKTICVLKKEICYLEKERENDHKSICALKKKICFFEKEAVFLRNQIDALQKEKIIDKEEIYRLKNEVKSLSSYAFSGQLRKLLKNLLNYLIECFKESIAYDKINKKFVFFESPYSEKDIDSIKALNSLLEIIFYHSTKSDYIVHYIDKKATINKEYTKKITVFKNANAFFDYFKISKKEGNILLKYIPEEYLTSIDNVKFELKIPEILSKLGIKFL